jgi:DNA-binding protein HU-beta
MSKVLTKAGLVAEVALRGAFPLQDAEMAVETALEVMEEALASGRRVSLFGFGTFQVVERPERAGVNPRTLLPIRIPASRGVRFRPGIRLRGRIVASGDQLDKNVD